jgi:hypothetical protein
MENLLELEPIAIHLLCTSFSQDVQCQSLKEIKTTNVLESEAEKPDQIKWDRRFVHFPVDLYQLYDALVLTKGMDLELAKKPLYKALNVHPRLGTSVSYKLVKNNINYKLGTIVKDYPHLARFGKASLFTIYRLWYFPEILLSNPLQPVDETLKTRFKQFKPDRKIPVQSIRNKHSQTYY